MKPVIISTVASAYFGKLIADKLPGSEELPVDRKEFGDGERYLRLEVADRLGLIGRDVIIVGSTATDADFVEVCRLATAAAKYGARQLIFVIPFFGYSTMERAVLPGEIVTAKINARQLSQLPSGDRRNCFLMLDLHTAGLLHYFEGECLRFELYGEPVLTRAVEELNLSNFMFGSADLSRPKWVESFAKKFGTSLAFVRKSRSFETTQVHEVIGGVKRKNVIIYDDMTRSFHSLDDAAEAYLNEGAEAVWSILSHLAFSNEKVAEVLTASSIKRIIGTNSHPMSQLPCFLNHPKITVVDVSPLFVDAIVKILEP
jgi:ribose-phosphate pyrophosphokinase